MFDSLPLHIAPSCLAIMASRNIWPLVIPPKATPLLQVLDTHAFSSFKQELRNQYDSMRGQRRGDISMISFLQCLRDAVDLALVNRDWRRAFDDNGFAPNQANMSQHVLRAVQFDAHVPSCAPTLEDVEKCCPRKSGIASKMLWKRFVLRERVTITSSRAATVSAHAPPEVR
jgi:hypothetical protein